MRKNSKILLDSKIIINNMVVKGVFQNIEMGISLDKVLTLSDLKGWAL